MKWRDCRLGDVITLQRGHDLPESDRQPGDVPVVTSSGITGRHNIAKAQAPGVVTGRYGTLGDVYFLREDYWPHNTALYVKDFRGTHPHFAAYFLENSLRNYQSDKAAVPGIDRNVLHDLKVRVPDRQVQERIVDSLSPYDDLIENNRRRMVLLEESARQVYQEWFVRIRFPGHEHTRVLDGVPEGWTRKAIGDYYNTSSGGTPSRKVPEYFTGDIPWVKTGELLGGFVIDTEEKITEEAVHNSSAKLFPKRTVLVALYGATVGALGVLSMPATTNQACCAVIPTDTSPGFAYAYLTLAHNRERLVGLSAGAAQKNISQQLVREFPFLVPGQTIQETFNRFVEPTFDQFENLQRQNQKLRAVRDLLLPRLMSGEVAV